MTGIDAGKALALWRQAGLLDAAKAAELSRYLEQQAPPPHGGRALAIFAGFGVVLVGLGLILFIASHWPGMSPLARILTLFLAYALVVALAATAALREYPRVAEALWLLVSLALGANIFLIGQLFNLSLTYWQAPLLWLVGVLALAYAARSRLNAWLAVPLLLLTLGWAGGGRGWFTDDQWEFLVSPTGLKALFPLLGLGLLSLGLLLRRRPGWRFASGTWTAWGALMVALPLVLATIDTDVLEWLFELEPQTRHWLIMLLCAGLVVFASLAVVRDDARLRTLLLGLALILMALPLLGAAGIGISRGNRLFLLYPLAVLLLALITVWLGAGARQSGLINIGMGSAAIVVFIQYFSWSFRLLDRSLAFLIGGTLLIGLSFWIEHKRRRLVRELGP